MHIPINLINVAIITLSAGVGLTLVGYLLIWLKEHNIPLLGPAANAVLQFAPHLV
jgi:hypothetical protein